ncbi:MAG: DUF1015 domain-containing protein [Clostridia bacterium]|nr:DUF1015 domain-containing protein [Clostridia bacterium]
MNKHLLPADILLPKNDFSKWSVIACDQYTSEPKYWEETKEIVGNSISALNLILPEVFLSDDESARINSINKTMQEYIENDVFNSFDNTIVYTCRTLKDGKKRHGLVGLIDLEDYSYEKDAKTAIRATEETVVDRIPPRVKIRKDAPLELPHIMLLIDDPERIVIEPIADKADNFKKLYEFELMQNAGSIVGYALSSDSVNNVQSALDTLKNNSADGLLFAVGDGNHSLATAKECYRMGCGSRYALVEVVNIHDFSLEFEPIYRVVFGANAEKLISDFINWCGEDSSENSQKFTCVYNGIEKEISVNAKGTLCVATLQAFLDNYLKDNKNLKLDYIHGTESVRELCKKENTVGFIFSGMEKSELFKAVSNDGSLPRKTFSMGCADDKRFYLEARKIK